MAKEKKPSYSDYIVMHFATVALKKSEPPFPFVYLKSPTTLHPVIWYGGTYEDAAVSIFVIHNSHELHQLKKVLPLLRGSMTIYQYYRSI